MKKEYIQPSTQVVSLQHQEMLAPSSVKTSSTSSDVNLTYDKDGGNAEDAW